MNRRHNGKYTVSALFTICCVLVTGCDDAEISEDNKFESMPQTCDLISDSILKRTLGGTGSPAPGSLFPPAAQPKGEFNLQQDSCHWRHEKDTEDLQDTNGPQSYKRSISIHVALYGKTSESTSIGAAKHNFNGLQEDMGFDQEVPVGDEGYTAYAMFGPGEWLKFRRANITVMINFQGTNVSRTGNSGEAINTVDISKEAAHKHALQVAENVDSNLKELM